MSSQEKTKTCKDQEDEKMTGESGGRQKYKHVDSDLPLCMRSKGDEVEVKMKENEKTQEEEAEADKNFDMLTVTFR